MAEHVHTPKPIVRRRGARPTGGVLDRRVDATRDGLMRPLITLTIEVQQPQRPRGRPRTRTWTGTLRGAMYNAGTLHHLRIVDDDGVMWLVPPGWLTDNMRNIAEMAFDQLDAWFLNFIRTVPADQVCANLAKAIGMPEESTPDDMLAHLRQRALEATQ